MPVKFEFNEVHKKWAISVTGKNNRNLVWSWGYNSYANAKTGAKAALKELQAWAAKKQKPATKPKAKR